MPVTVATEGAVLRKPPVSKPSVGLDGTPAGPGTGLPGNEGPGNHPLGLPGLLGAWKLGALPAWAPIRPSLIKVLPTYQSNPSARLSSWVTSMNLARLVNCGGDMFSIWIAFSIVSRSWSVARTISTPRRSLKKTALPGSLRLTPAVRKKLLTVGMTISEGVTSVRNEMPP